LSGVLKFSFEYQHKYVFFFAREMVTFPIKVMITYTSITRHPSYCTESEYASIQAVLKNKLLGTRKNEKNLNNI